MGRLPIRQEPIVAVDTRDSAMNQSPIHEPIDPFAQSMTQTIENFPGKRYQLK